MMKDVLLLIAGITCILIAFVCFVACAALTKSYIEREHAPELFEDHSEKTLRIVRLTNLLVGVVFVITACVAWQIYRYLEAEAPYILTLFGWWYAGGFVSRFLILVHRHSVLSSILATEWAEVFGALFWAICGPFVTIHLLKELFLGRKWPS